MGVLLVGDHGREMIESCVQIVPFVIHYTQEPVRPILTRCQVALLREPEQMACCLFHLLQFACSQIDDCLGKEETSGAIKMCRMFSQTSVQFKERHVFMSDSLVGECQEKESVARDKLLVWHCPFQRRAGA